MPSTSTKIGNGCTWFVDTWRGINIRPCCDEHDEAFYLGTNVVEFIWANIQIAICFAERGAFELSVPAFIATTLIGGLFFVAGAKAIATRQPSAGKRSKDED